jgi:hypothetical protein
MAGMPADAGMRPMRCHAEAQVRVLIGCEFSGAVRRAFRERGHEAWSADFLPAEDGSPYHYQGDIRQVPWRHGAWWDLAIFHPTCTRLTNSGVRWLHERNLWAELDEAAALFRFCLDFPADRVAVENPIPHRYALERIGRKYDQIIQPWQFGHGETKATWLWLKNLPPLVPTNIVDGREAKVHRMPPGPDRWKERSRTYSGVAAAFADQWGNLLTGVNQ